MTDVFSQLSTRKIEIPFSPNIDFGSFFKGSPTVSEFHSFIGIVNH